MSLWSASSGSEALSGGKKALSGSKEALSGSNEALSGSSEALSGSNNALTPGDRDDPGARSSPAFEPPPASQPIDRSTGGYFTQQLAERARRDAVAYPATIDKLLKLAASYLPDEQVQQIAAAHAYAEKKHDGQVRRTGHPYITHPLAVANILAGIRLDAERAAEFRRIYADEPDVLAAVALAAGDESP